LARAARWCVVRREEEFDEILLKAKALIEAIVTAQRGSMEGAAFEIEGRFNH